MKKIILGLVMIGVMISSSYGATWSSWNNGDILDPARFNAPYLNGGAKDGYINGVNVKGIGASTSSSIMEWNSSTLATTFNGGISGTTLTLNNAFTQTADYNGAINNYVFNQNTGNNAECNFRVACDQAGVGLFAYSNNQPDYAGWGILNFMSGCSATKIWNGTSANTPIEFQWAGQASALTTITKTGVVSAQSYQINGSYAMKWKQVSGTTDGNGDIDLGVAASEILSVQGYTVQESANFPILAQIAKTGNVHKLLFFSADGIAIATSRTVALLVFYK